MPGNPRQVWFPDMIAMLRFEWRPRMSWEELLELRDRLEIRRVENRRERGIRPTVRWCPNCQQHHTFSPAPVSVRAVILALGRFGVAEQAKVQALEKAWKKYRKENRLDRYGKLPSQSDRGAAPRHHRLPQGGASVAGDVNRAPAPADPADKKYVLREIEVRAEEPDSAALRIRALGAAAIPPLLEILTDESLRKDDSRVDGLAPVHAAELLGAMRAIEAIEPMLDIIKATSRSTLLHGYALDALAAIGRPALEPALKRLELTNDDGEKRSLTEACSRMGTRDKRLYKLLLARLETDPEMGAGNLLSYGDPAAMEALQAAMSRLPVSRQRAFESASTLIELEHAIKGLGGTLSQANLEKMAYVRELWRLAASHNLDSVPEDDRE